MPGSEPDQPTTLRTPRGGMKKVVLITANRFWRRGAGVWARTGELVRFLSTHCELVIVFTQPIRPDVLQRLQDPDMAFRFVAIADTDTLKPPAMLNALRSIGAAFDPADAYIIDKLENSLALAALPASVQRFVDTHDLLSQKTLSMQGYGYQPRIPMSEAHERELLSQYDGVLCIQRDDYAIVRDWLGPKKAILAPHPAAITPRVFRHKVTRIGFAASNWLPNVEGLQWFLTAVWPAFIGRGIYLDVHGAIKDRFTSDRSPGVRFHGHTDSPQAIYAEIDILINPVRFGSGLKIKTVEALGNGIPLVTTSEGARGLTDADGQGLLIADDAPSFIEALETLVNSPALRQRISAGALGYARTQLSPEVCFGELIARINAS